MWPRVLALYVAALVVFCCCHEMSAPASTQGAGSRQRRQIPLFQLPRIFFTLFRVVKETRNDTKSAIQQISQILENSIRDEPSTLQPPVAVTEADSNVTTTTEYTISRQELLRILRRNIRGLVKLFNTEVDIAVNDSYRNVAETKMEFRDSLRQFLLPATTTTTTTTTTEGSA